MFTQGQPVWWEDQLYRTGYAGLPVRAIYIRQAKSKVWIAVEMRNGEWWPKRVSASSLRERKAQEVLR